MMGIKLLQRLQGHRADATATGAPPSVRLWTAQQRSMLPHRVSIEERRRPAFWNPTTHYKRLEFLVSPPMLPGTAIPYTLFHPTYIPGLQGFKDYLAWNFGWAWGRNNFERFGALVQRLASEAATSQSTTRRSATWKPGMNPQPFLNGQVWVQAPPDYSPLIVNPPARGARGGNRAGRG